jgi:hypothetical protein
MNELLMIGGNKGAAGLDIDFENLDVGSKVFRDKNGHPFTLVGTLGTDGGVVDDPDVGKCFYFPGGGYFETPMVKDLNIPGKASVIEAVFKWPTGGPARQGSIFETGNFPSGHTATPGISLSVGQYPATYIQYFLMGTDGNWVRGLPPNTTNIYVWETVRFERNANGSGLISVYRDGNLFSSVSVPANTIGNGSKLSVGGSYTWTTGWRGYLKSLKITFK